jgi:hypothetical protein
VADETLYLTHREIQDVRWKADHRDQPGALYRGQRIIGYSRVDGRWRIQRRSLAWRSGVGGWRVAGTARKARRGGDHARQAKGGRYEDERQKP